MLECQYNHLVNEKVLKRFEFLNKSGFLAHAYLFAGPRGGGKFETALETAKMINCVGGRGESGCRCESCVKIDAGSHPDVVIVSQGDDQSIKIHKIRELIQKVQLLPYEAKKKILILKDIDLLTPESANALLKTLEEPASSSLFLLTTSALDRVFETIRSRCHVVHFFGSSRQIVVERLKNSIRMAEEQREVLAGFSEGCFGKACRMHDEKFMASKNEVIDQFLSGGDERFFKSLYADTGKIRQALEVLIFCFKDILLLKAGAPEACITNSDRQKEMRMYSKRYSNGQLGDVLSAIVQTKKMLDAGLNIKIPLMLLKEKIWNVN